MKKVESGEMFKIRVGILDSLKDLNPELGPDISAAMTASGKLFNIDESLRPIKKDKE